LWGDVWFGTVDAYLVWRLASGSVFATETMLSSLADPTLFGQVTFLVGEAKCTYGTGIFFIMSTGKVPVPSTR